MEQFEVFLTQNNKNSHELDVCVPTWRHTRSPNVPRVTRSSERTRGCGDAVCRSRSNCMMACRVCVHLDLVCRSRCRIYDGVWVCVDLVCMMVCRLCVDLDLVVWWCVECVYDLVCNLRHVRSNWHNHASFQMSQSASLLCLSRQRVNRCDNITDTTSASVHWWQ